MRYNNILSQSTSQQLSATDLNPPPVNPSSGKDSTQSTRRVGSGSGGTGFKEKIYRAFSLSKQKRRQPSGAGATALLGLPSTSNVGLLPNEPESFQIGADETPRLPDNNDSVKRANAIKQPRAPRTRRSWHSDMLLFSPSSIRTPIHNDIRHPRRRTSFSYFSSPEATRQTQTIPPPALGHESSSPGPILPRTLSSNSGPRSPSGETSHSPGALVTQEMPLGRSERRTDYKKSPLCERHMNFHSPPPPTPPRPIQNENHTPSTRRLLQSSRASRPLWTKHPSPKFEKSRKPVQAYDDASSTCATNVAGTVTPAKRWEPLHVTPRVRLDENQFETQQNKTTLHTPPTPYFCRLNDTSPSPSLSPSPSPSSSLSLSPSDSISTAQWREECIEHSEYLIDSAQEELYDDVLTTWGLPPSSSGARLIRSQSVPLDLHIVPSTAEFIFASAPGPAPTAEQYPSTRPHGAHSLRASTTGVPSGFKRQGGVTGRKEERSIEPCPTFYPSGRSFATIRANKTGPVGERETRDAIGSWTRSRASLIWDRSHQDSRKYNRSRRHQESSENTPRIEVQQEERPRALARSPLIRTLTQRLTGRVKKAVQQIEGTRGDSPPLPLTPLREIGKILKQPSSVSSLDLGEESRRMMIEAREKRLRPAQATRLGRPD